MNIKEAEGILKIKMAMSFYNPYNKEVESKLKIQKNLDFSGSLNFQQIGEEI